MVKEGEKREKEGGRVHQGQGESSLGGRGHMVACVSQVKEVRERLLASVVNRWVRERLVMVSEQLVSCKGQTKRRWASMVHCGGGGSKGKEVVGDKGKSSLQGQRVLSFASGQKQSL
jgi:hypothetical protein